MAKLTPEKLYLSSVTDLEEVFNAEVLEIATLVASGTIQKLLVSAQFLEGNKAGQPVGTVSREREVRHIDILSSFVGVSPALAGILEIDGRRKVYVPVPPEVGTRFV